MPSHTTAHTIKTGARVNALRAVAGVVAVLAALATLTGPASASSVPTGAGVGNQDYPVCNYVPGEVPANVPCQQGGALVPVTPGTTGYSALTVRTIIRANGQRLVETQRQPLRVVNEGTLTTAPNHEAIDGTWAVVPRIVWPVERGTLLYQQTVVMDRHGRVVSTTPVADASLRIAENMQVHRLAGGGVRITGEFPAIGHAGQASLVQARLGAARCYPDCSFDRSWQSSTGSNRRFSFVLRADRFDSATEKGPYYRLELKAPLRVKARVLVVVNGRPRIETKVVTLRQTVVQFWVRRLHNRLVVTVSHDPFVSRPGTV